MGGKGYWVHASAYTPYLSPYQLHVPYINYWLGKTTDLLLSYFPLCSHYDIMPTLTKQKYLV